MAFIPIRIPEDDLPNMINKQVHVSWARKGCVWNLLKVEGVLATLKTPKTHKVITTHINNLLYIRKHGQDKENRTRDSAQ